MNNEMKTNGLPNVSIIIPAYNHADYLRQSIDSVLAQDYTNLELIVIDDGSTDNTVEVLKELGNDFIWESQANEGQSNTLNKGWDLAKGDILAYLSADDVLEPNAVTAAVSALQKYPDVVATYCDFKLLDSASRLVRVVKTPEYSYEKMLTTVSCPIGPGAFFRRSAYLKSGPWNPTFKQMPDYDFWLRLGLHGGIIRLPQVLAGFRVHEGSQTYSIASPQRAEESVQIVTNLINDKLATDLELDIKQRALASANLVSAQLHLRAGRPGSALDNIRKAWRHSPSCVFALRTLRLLFNSLINRLAHRLLSHMRNLVEPRQK